MFLPHFDVLSDLLLDRCTATWNLFVLYNKELNFVRIRFISREARESGAFPILTNTKKAIWRHLWSIQNEPISLVAMRSKGWWLVQENHATVKLVSSVASRGMKTYSETRIKLRNLQFKSVFVIRAALWAEKLGCCLESCRSCKNTFGKLAILVNLEAIRFEFWT